MTAHSVGTEASRRSAKRKRGSAQPQGIDRPYSAFVVSNGFFNSVLVPSQNLFRPLYQSSDGAAAVRKAPVRAVGMDLIAFVFGFFQGRREDNAAAGGVGFHGVGERGGVRQTEDGLEHLDHIFER